MLDAWYERLDADELTARFGTRLDADGRELFDPHLRQGPAQGQRPRRPQAHRESTASSASPACRRCLTPLHELHDAAARTSASLGAGLLEQYAAGLHADRRHLFRSYRFLDMARKVVGVGSVGTRAWIFLLARRRPDPLVLQAKEAQASVLEPYLGASEYKNHGERVVRGQRMMQAATDIFLSWQRSTGLDGVEHDFYVRQLWDWKASADLSRMSEHGLLTYSRACAWSLARSTPVGRPPRDRRLPRQGPHFDARHRGLLPSLRRPATNPTTWPAPEATACGRAPRDQGSLTRPSEDELVVNLGARRA